MYFLASNLHMAGPVVFVAKLSDFVLASFESYLSVDEQSRMHSFRREKDRQRYTLAHFLKRCFLAKHFDMPLPDVKFGTNGYGKPFCDMENAPYFNLSHSGEWVVIAVSLLSKVGVDIEFPRKIDMQAVMKKISSEDQLERYSASSSPEQAFLCTWTQKEAISKACGRGLAVGLSGVPCSSSLGEGDLHFLSESYYFLSCLMPDQGVLSYSATNSAKPAIIRVKADENRAGKLSCVPFKLECK